MHWFIILTHSYSCLSYSNCSFAINIFSERRNNVVMSDRNIYEKVCDKREGMKPRHKKASRFYYRLKVNLIFVCSFIAIVPIVLEPKSLNQLKDEGRYSYIIGYCSFSRKLITVSRHFDISSFFSYLFLDTLSDEESIYVLFLFSALWLRKKVFYLFLFSLTKESTFLLMLVTPRI